MSNKKLYFRDDRFIREMGYLVYGKIGMWGDYVPGHFYRHGERTYFMAIHVTSDYNLVLHIGEDFFAELELEMLLVDLEEFF